MIIFLYNHVNRDIMLIENGSTVLLKGVSSPNLHPNPHTLYILPSIFSHISLKTLFLQLQF